MYPWPKYLLQKPKFLMSTMALVRLPNQSPIFPLQNLHKHPNYHRSNSSVSFSGSPSSISPLSHTPTDTFPIKARNFNSFIARLSTATQNPVVNLQSNDENEEKEEFSDTRLLAQNVPWTCSPEDIRSLFEKYGSVLDVELSMYNKINNRGLAFVTMGSPEEAQLALSKLDSYEFEGRVLKLSYAKVNKKKPPAMPVQPKPVLAFNLFVANLSYEVRGHHLKELFSSEGGKVVSAEVIYHDNPRRPSGYGFISFKSKKDADAALYAFQGKSLMGRPIRVQRSRQFVKLSEKGSQSNAKSKELNSGSEQVDASDEILS